MPCCLSSTEVPITVGVSFRIKVITVATGDGPSETLHPRSATQGRTKFGSLADVEEHWVEAATYEVVCTRRADHLLELDDIMLNVVLILTSITSLGVFSMIAKNPATWAKITVGVVTGAAAVLTALRQQNHRRWAQDSRALRERGIAWNRQRTFAGDLAAQILDHETVDHGEAKRLDDDEARLLKNHPTTRTLMHKRVKRTKYKEFDSIYKHRNPCSPAASTRHL